MVAVVGFAEIWKGRRGSVDYKNVRTYTRSFLVQMDALIAGPFNVSAIAQIPTIFTAYSDPAGGIDLGARVIKYDTNQREDPFYWDITVNYSSKIDNAEQANKGSTDQNPLNRPPVIKIGGSRYQKVVEKEQLVAANAGTGAQPITNTALQPFDPAPEIDATRIVYTYERNEAILDSAKIMTYQDVVNTDVWNGFAAHTCKINITADFGYENGQSFWHYTYTVEVRREGWDFQPLDRGTMQLNASSVPVNIYDQTNGSPVSQPVLLDGHGKVLAAGGTPVFLKYYVYGEAAFATLGIPL